jgi:hypothetical protein
MKKKYFKYLIWQGKVNKVECVEHSYAWSGKMPCTGILKCVYCGKVKDEN